MVTAISRNLQSPKWHTVCDVHKVHHKPCFCRNAGPPRFLPPASSAGPQTFAAYVSLPYDSLVKEQNQHFERTPIVAKACPNSNEIILKTFRVSRSSLRFCRYGVETTVSVSPDAVSSMALIYDHSGPYVNTRFKLFVSAFASIQNALLRPD